MSKLTHPVARRLYLFVLFLTAVVALGLSRNASADESNRVEVCHVNSAGSPAIRHNRTEFDFHDPNVEDIVREDTLTFFIGRVIEVDESDVTEHLEHGDSTFFATDMSVPDTFFEGREDTHVVREFDGFTFTFTQTYTDGVIVNHNCWFSRFTRS